MHGVVVGAPDVVHGDRAVRAHVGVAAQDVGGAVGNVADHRLCGEQLRAVDGIGAGGADPARGHVADLALCVLRAHADDAPGVISGEAAIGDVVYRTRGRREGIAGHRTRTQRNRVGIRGLCTLAEGRSVLSLSLGTSAHCKRVGSHCRRTRPNRRRVVARG